MPPRRYPVASPHRSQNRVLKFLLACFLLPLLWGQLLTLGDLFFFALPEKNWTTSWVWFLSGGFLIEVLVYFALPRPVWMYVLGHELTHALSVFLAGGKVHAFHIRSSGGFIATDTIRWWIALSPYFIPFYTLLFMALWLSIDFYCPLGIYRELFFFGIGFTYAFHITFTCSMIHRDQTDLQGEGFFFSGVIILLLNIVFLTLFFIPLAHEVSWRQALALLGNHIIQSYALIPQGLQSLQKWMLDL